MYCFNYTDFYTIYRYTSIPYPCEALAVFKLSAKCRQCRQNPYFAKKKKYCKPFCLQYFSSGDGGIRTHDLYTASVALSQLSYAPMRFSNDLTIIQENSQNFNTFFYYFSADFMCLTLCADFQPGFSAPIFTPFPGSCRRGSFAVYFF